MYGSGEGVGKWEGSREVGRSLVITSLQALYVHTYKGTYVHVETSFIHYIK